ncbi:hypothetical protein ACFOJ6_18450 [Gordonia humi]|uniref:hypothetical protein n=1 Tax=Gordonia humi TaxID=686429 RepID=UPI0036188CEA
MRILARLSTPTRSSRSTVANVKLRGKISPGLIVPGTDSELASFDAGNDLTNRLDIVKWEPSTPGEHSGVVRGPFPASLARKTNAGRVQNFSPAVFDDPRAAGPWTATEKGRWHTDHPYPRQLRRSSRRPSGRSRTRR